MNAIVRKAFNWSSNGLLEIQWYLFAGAFLLGAAYTLLHNEHVRIDVVSGKFSRRTQTWIEVIGSIFSCCLSVRHGPLDFGALVPELLASGETSSNAGGLILWPAKILVPIGFTLLTAQGISELIKRLAFLKGLIPDPTESTPSRPRKRTSSKN